MHYCPNCGYKITNNANAQFCPNCGSKIEANSTPQQPESTQRARSYQTPSSGQRPSYSSSILRSIVIFILVVIIVYLITSISMSNGFNTHMPRIIIYLIHFLAHIH